MVIPLLSSCDNEDETTAVNAAFAVDESSELEVGYTISFQNASTGAFSYLWSFGDGNTAIGTNATHVYAMPGEYEVTLEASGNGSREVFSEAIMISPNNSELYFIDNDALKMRKIVLGDPKNPVDVFDLPGFCIGMEYDEVNEELYYSDDDNKAVYKNDLSGSSEVEIASGFAGPRDLAFDSENNVIYVADRSADEIVKVELSDNSTSVIYSVADDSDFLLPVGLDLYEGNLYATAVEEDVAETVWKGGTDGSGIERIIDFNTGGFGYGLEVDEVNEKIYFDDNQGSNIRRANLDGTEVENFAPNTDRTYGIAIFHEIGKVFWVGEDGILYSANLDGTEVETVVNLDTDIRGLELRKVN